MHTANPVLKHGLRLMRTLSFRAKIGGFAVALLLPLWAVLALQMGALQQRTAEAVATMHETTQLSELAVQQASDTGDTLQAIVAAVGATGALSVTTVFPAPPKAACKAGRNWVVRDLARTSNASSIWSNSAQSAEWLSWALADAMPLVTASVLLGCTSPPSASNPFDKPKGTMASRRTGGSVAPCSARALTGADVAGRLRRMVANNTSVSNGLDTKSSIPALRQVSRSSSNAFAVSAMMRSWLQPGNWRICRVASAPSITGI